MSQDLFAAFGDPIPETSVPKVATSTSALTKENLTEAINGASETADDEDDFGDFEDAQAFEVPSSNQHDPKPDSIPTVAGASMPSTVQRESFPPKARKKSGSNSEPVATDSKIGKHPFAGHMDFLFDAGDDEYDAGADDLDNLASNPEAAMAYSKRLIAEQEAKSSSKSDPTKSYAQQLAAHTKELSQKISQSAVSQPNSILAEQQSRPRKRSKAAPPIAPKSQAASNPPPARNKLQKKSGYVPAKDPNVLFDADNVSESDEAEDDDFGDFEGGPSVSIATVTPAPAQPPQPQTTMPNIDLLGLGDSAAPMPLGQVGRTRSASMRQADSVLGPPKHAPSKSLTTNLVIADDNPWADFETEIPKAVAPRKSVVSESMGDDAWDDFEAAEPIPAPAVKQSEPSPHQKQAESTSQLPPTNIPPPALLLSAFPSIFSSAQDALLNPISKLDTKQRSQLLAHPASSQFLRSFLNSALVLAHIIAGRKLRWKRDQILSQSMRIGPAAAGGKGGMKLTGVDKSEVTKEEREVLDAVRLWKAQVGKLRTAVSGATATGQKLPSVPDINEQMPVKLLKAVEGGFVAPHPCALCGMKREERIAKIDENVEDSFGEWWVQGMDMHVFCKSWWDENKNKLRSR